MAKFDGMQVSDAYYERVDANNQQSARNMQQAGQFMTLQKMQQDMQNAPEDRALKMRLGNAQVGQYEAQAAEHNANAAKKKEAAAIIQQISILPPDHPDRPMLIQKARMILDPTGALDPTKGPQPTSLARLYGERDALPPNDPRRAAYDNAIRKESETARQISPTIVMPKQDKVPMGYRVTPEGNLEAIPGGPADVKATALMDQKTAGASGVNSAVATLRDAYDRLEAGGGITSTKSGPVANIAASTASSGLGQVLGKTFGTKNQSARNDIAMTRPALLAALMKATGMSAKQMDSNVELKLWMTTATDPTLDVESNRRALDAIEEKYLGGGGGGGTQSYAGKIGVPKNRMAPPAAAQPAADPGYEAWKKSKGLQ